MKIKKINRGEIIYLAAPVYGAPIFKGRYSNADKELLYSGWYIYLGEIDLSEIWSGKFMLKNDREDIGPGLVLATKNGPRALFFFRESSYDVLLFTEEDIRKLKKQKG